MELSNEWIELGRTVFKWMRIISATLSPPPPVASYVWTYTFIEAVTLISFYFHVWMRVKWMNLLCLPGSLTSSLARYCSSIETKWCWCLTCHCFCFFYDRLIEKPHSVETYASGRMHKGGNMKERSRGGQVDGGIEMETGEGTKEGRDGWRADDGDYWWVFTQ